METALLNASYVTFIFFGSLALLNAYLGKWGGALGMFGLMAIAFASGVLHGVDIVWSVFVAIVATTSVAMYFVASRKKRQK